ncbi:MAG: alanine--tRNA ligase [Bacteroidetes bacterium GWE2_41_25]|nr:MAG: alanine--tRNA ligase [Bacteroidetes bacterium GWA2_40_15]OFX89765.1 MAG: alanine--tRNA ligase [Bacteroidetes bacterium GWC2_40_22]OFY00689.1 MAG: alanine--tRNA ligase [Bacteroidetes bacterium GWE2_41_25]OFY61227.1 MAG: alanine--tRNA ligase [Bacteroidetes bacterium GWF2_41_9]HAM09106.1 alanine--tRNA ligase [Bacteroidales bacterium]
MKSRELRQLFFEFFRSKGHTIVPSAPMVIKNDPTLMFTNAGMNQFKDIFLGHQQPGNKRVANSQKCLRVSGKHNDLEEVGHDTYHHTMFEMLGNWSFGDYFKKESIEWAWELLVHNLGIPEDRLYATIFEGSMEDNIERDNEASGYWKSCFSDPEGRIIEGSKKDNFWEMGESGPCGPCSEIHVDIRDDAERKKIAGRDLVNKGHPHVIEVWNLVFIQYNRKADGTLEQLPSKHVDTGMGFERLCMIVQGRKSNYETDIFQSVISEISLIAGKPYGKNEKWDVALRVIADHLRAVAFSIADGQIPSNNKAGYVIRRILRRAVRYGYNNLGMEEPFIYKLIPVFSETMGNQYPELESGKENIAKIIFEEEAAFLKTLGKGLKMIDKMVADLRKDKKNTLPGKAAFELYDTFGFPVDLTQLILKENKMDIDTHGFEEEMKAQKERSREDAVVETTDWTIVNGIEGTLFTGYQKTEDDVVITKYRKVKGKGKDTIHLVLNKTPFYGEAGGQTGDTGVLFSAEEKILISDTIKENNLIIHIASKIPSVPTAQFKAIVDLEKRLMTANNHTATHLLHQALRAVLGNHVEQKGSLVTPERLRFDFSHFSKPGKEELARVENMVNRLIRENHSGKVTDGIPMEKAKAMGAMALFGEKYGDRVRVVEFGSSVELCGGTHVESTGSIGLLKIVSESAIAAGIRRIEAVTAEKAMEFINEKISTLDDISAMLKSTGNVKESVEKLLSDNSSLKKTIERFEAQSAEMIIRDLSKKAVSVNNLNFISGQLDNESPEMLRNIAFHLRKSSENTVLALGSASGGKANIVVMVSDNLIKERNISATALIKEVSGEINGGGGGQPFLATAGGKNPAGIARALEKVFLLIQKS